MKPILATIVFWFVLPNSIVIGQEQTNQQRSAIELIGQELFNDTVLRPGELHSLLEDLIQIPMTLKS